MFCGQTDSPQHVEDVFAKWIARELAAIANTDVAFIAKTGALGDPEWPALEYPAASRLGWEIKGPCRRCNNTWMSKLENAARPILLPLMRGDACTLDATQLTTLAQWAVKTTVMFEYLRDASDWFFTRADRRGLCEGRTIPPDTFIYAARYVGPGAMYSIGGPMTVNFPDSSTAVRGYCATHAIGQVALQVLSFKRPEHIDDTLNIRIPARWDPIAKPLWPHPPGWRWPPEFVLLNDDEFRAFATRVPVEIR